MKMTMAVVALSLFGMAAVGSAAVPDGTRAAPDDSIAGAATDTVAVAPDWQALADLIESLPDDLDEETKALIIDLLAESARFASARARVPDNELKPEQPPTLSLSVLSRAEGVYAGEWRSFDSRTYLRFRGDVAGRVTFGAAAERDPGEHDALDHVCGYLRWGMSESTDADSDGPAGPEGGKSKAGGTGRPRAAVIAGDVIVEWGQRLVAGAAAFGAPGGPEVADRLRGYDGAAESASRRGAAARVRIGTLDVTVLATRTSLDVGLDDEGRVTTVRTSGTHVTEGERAGMDALRESVLGVRLVRSDGVSGDGMWRAGVSALRIRYDRPFVPADLRRSRFGFEGDALDLCGVDASGDVRDLRWGAEIAAHAPGEHAALITIEARRGRARVLLGADLVSRGFYSPLGASPPGASSGGNCTSSWLRVSYGIRGSWSAWCRGRVTGHPWRTYSEPLPPRTGAFAAGGSARLGRAARLTAEVSVRGETGSSAEPHSTESTTDRRERLSLVAGRDRRWKLWLARSARTKDGSGYGRRTGVGCSLASVLSDRGDRLDAGVMLVSGEGSAPTLYAGEPGLPGAFGLRSLKGSGAGWYIRARKALPAGALVTVRVSRSVTGEELTLGLAVEAGTTCRR